MSAGKCLGEFIRRHTTITSKRTVPRRTSWMGLESSQGRSSLSQGLGSVSLTTLTWKYLCAEVPTKHLRDEGIKSTMTNSATEVTEITAEEAASHPTTTIIGMTTAATGVEETGLVPIEVEIVIEIVVGLLVATIEMGQEPDLTVRWFLITSSSMTD